ncbi:hypothetical protein [Methylobacterium nigriterrae]|uniref:hypothetical protein n=1 Tax=Methylobacterium nigriterrae TaxID=3127512 RepID=UPI003013A6A5
MTTRLRLGGCLGLLAAAIVGPAPAQEAGPGVLHAPQGGAQAAEPLFLRIRPQGAEALGAAGGSLSDAEAAARARAAREAVWQRAASRARIAIASICTGCLGPEPARTGAIGVEPAAPETGPRPGSLASISGPSSEPSTRGDP